MYNIGQIAGIEKKTSSLACPKGLESSETIGKASAFKNQRKLNLK